MFIFRHLAYLTVVVLCLVQMSCIDGREEIWLNADGSGRADLRYDIPAAAARLKGGEQGIKDLIEPLLKDMSFSSYDMISEGDRLKVNVRLAFKSASQVASLTSSVEEKKIPAAFEYLAGQFRFSRSLRTVDFTRIISPGKALPTAFIPASQFKNRRLTYILHLPVVATESTADRISDGGKTLIWDQPLSRAIRKPMVIHFKADIPIPFWMIACAAVVVTALAISGWRLWKTRGRGLALLPRRPSAMQERT